MGKSTIYRTVYTFLLLLFFIVGRGQIIVSSAAGSFNPAISYTTLTGTNGAFNAINNAIAGTGAITISVTADSPNETGAVALNHSTNWTAVGIYNNGSTKTISGSAPIGSALLSFDGADNVTIGGIINSPAHFIISNTAVGGNGTATIKLINDAKNNSIQYCTIEGSSNDIDSATVMIGAGSNTGNTGNSISNNTIRAAGINLPTNGIMLDGTSTSNNNADNTISFNLIQNYFNPSTDSNGILVKKFSNFLLINNNTIQQTAARTFTTAATTRGIHYLSAEQTFVASNIIGGGTTSYTGPGNSSFVGIHASGMIVTDVFKPSSINYNVVAGIVLNTDTGSFTGINMQGGTIVPAINTIGNFSTTESIKVTVGTTPATDQANFYGIRTNATASNFMGASNNLIAGIKVEGTSDAVGATLFGILSEGSSQMRFEFNFIGSATIVNSITCGTPTSTAACIIEGIRNRSSGATGPVASTSFPFFNDYFRYNYIQNITAYGNNSNGYFSGINNMGGIYNVTIANNTLTNINIFSNGTSFGILNSTNCTGQTINDNEINLIKIAGVTANFTGIQTSGNVIGERLDIKSNIFGTALGNFISYDVANSGILRCILNNSNFTSPSFSVNISSNFVQNIQHVISGSTTHNYIEDNGTASVGAAISTNTFRNLAIATSGSVCFMKCNRTLGTQNAGNGISINSNIISNFDKTIAGGQVYMLYSDKNYLRLQFFNSNNNNCTNIKVTGNTPLYGIYVANNGVNWKFVQNNTFKNWTGGTAPITACTMNGWGLGQFFRNEVVDIISAGNINGLITTGTNFEVTGNVDRNTIRNLTTTGGNINAIDFNSLSSINIHTNEISDLSSTFADASVYAIKGQNGGNNMHLKIYNNAISNIINSGSGISATTAGIIITGSNTSSATVYNNKINNLTQNATNATSRLYGILLEGGFTVTLLNNFISNLKAPSSNNPTAVTGIGITSAQASANFRIHHNTVVLSGTSAGANFGTDCFFHTANATANISTASFINNIFVNNCTPQGSGLCIAVRRTGTALNNYLANSNNNSYFVGTPSASKLIYYDGTNSIQSMSQLRTLVSPRESKSIYFSPVFVNFATGDLHLDATQNCKLDGIGEAVNLSANPYPLTVELSRDIDNDTRPDTNPDIGADEVEMVTATYSAGVWTSVPTLEKNIVFNGDYNSNAAVNGCKCVINTGVNVVVAPGGVLNLVNRVNVNGSATLNIQNNASLVQEDDLATNSGNIKADRTTSTYENFDYVYWSSPVVGATFGAPFATWRLNRAYRYITSNFIDLYSGAYPQTTGNPDTFDDNGDDWQAVTAATIMEPAKGYIVMTPATAAPTTSNVSFNGVPNNGVFSIPLGLSANNTSTIDDFNLVGNPYPSALDADQFIAANLTAGGASANNISGTLYIWTHVANIQPTATNPGPNAFNFNSNDYATYTRAGGVGAGIGAISGSGSTIPTGKIASGQSFFVEAETTNNLVINNSMRSANHDNSQFFRTSNTESIADKNRLRLNFRNVDNMFSQQLICYFDDATNGYDYGYDGIVSESQNYVSFYSLMPSNPNKYRIQAQPTWNNTKTVALGYHSVVSGSSSISIATQEGVFNSTNNNVYLQDNLLNVTHNLKTSPYVFHTAAGTFNNRFILKYVNTTLGVADDMDYQKTVIVAKKENQLTMKSAFLPMKQIIVFDLLGRKVYENNDVNKNEFIINDVVLNQQTIIVKITLDNGTVVTRKVVF